MFPMHVSIGGVQVSGKDYTWQESMRFLAIGMSYAVAYALIPVAVVLWHNYENYSDPVDWRLIGKLLIATVGTAVFGYWREHKALFKIPPFLDIPPEFRPDFKGTKTTSMEKHETTVITQTIEPAPSTDGKQ